MIISLKNIKQYFRLIFIFLYLFVYIYALLTTKFPIGLEKFIFLFSLVYILFKFKKFLSFLKKNTLYFNYFFINLFLFSYVGMMLVINLTDDTSLLYSIFLRMSVYYIPIVVLLYYIYEDSNIKDPFLFIMKSLLFITSLQSFFILLSFVNIDFKLFVDTLLVSGGNIDVSRMDRLRGFSNSSGANLSIAQGIGAYIAFYLFYKSNLFYNKILFIFLIIIHILALIFVARTGMMLFFVLTFVFLFSSLSLKTLKTLLYLVVVVFIIFNIILYSSSFLNPESLDLFYNKILPWAFELFINIFNNHEVTTSSNHSLSQMLYLPDSIKTFLIGDGIFERSYTNSDSGYVRYIFSIGIFGTTILVSSIIYIIVKIKFYSKLDKVDFRWLFLLVMFILFIDIKEPFLLKPVSYPIFLLVLLNFYMKNVSYKRGEVL